jgi:hypothetical protein
MAISNGSTILAADLTGIWTPGLATLRARSTANNPNKQFTETFHFDGIASGTAEYLRTLTYVPRTDVILRSAHIYCLSTTIGITATLSIPAQIILDDDNKTPGGNIKNTLTASAISASAVSIANSGGIVSTLSNTELFTFLAGDSINFVVSTNNVATSNVTVCLTLESILTG